MCTKVRGHYLLHISVAKQKGDKSKCWSRVFSTEWKADGWATEAAALAARAAFKHWVDYERNSQQRSAQSESSALRSSARFELLQRPPEPTRTSGRKRPREARAVASLSVHGSKVQLRLAVAESMPDSSPGPDELLQYHNRSAGALHRARKRLKFRSGLHAISCESEVLWSDIIARCEAHAARQAAAPETSKARARPRGATIANRVTSQKFARPVGGRRGVVNKGQILRSKKLITIVRISKF